MTGNNVINLNKVRKARAKKKHEAKAEQNRILFGRTKAQKARDEAEAREARQRLDRLKLQPDDQA